jgi:hypothetical protein
MADDKAKVESTLRRIVDTNIISDIDIRRVMFVFDWFLANSVDPNFALASFTHNIYVAGKWSWAVKKAAKTAKAAPNMLNAPISSTIDFLINVITVDANRKATPVKPGMTVTPKPHLLWKSPAVVSSRNSSNSHQSHSTDIILASSLPLDVLDFYRKLVVASKPAEIDLVPISAFDPDHTLWPHNWCADNIFEMNDDLALRLNQTAMLNLDDETIHILYQKHILDSSSGARTYSSLHALLKKAKHQLNDKMPTSPDIDKATSIGSRGANLDWYYLQLQTMGVSFDDKTKSPFHLSALQQKCIEVDWLVDRLDNVPDGDPLPEELTLAEPILCITDIHSFHNFSPAIVHWYVHPTNDNESSNTRPNRQSSSSNSRPDRQYLPSDSRPAPDFCTRSNTQCMCGRWGHSDENCQQMAMHFLITKFFQKDANLASAGQLLEQWHLNNEQYSWSNRSTVHFSRAMMPEDMIDRINSEIMGTLYNNDDALLDFL